MTKQTLAHEDAAVNLDIHVHHLYSEPISSNRGVWVAIAVSAALLYTTFSGDLLRPILSSPVITGIPYLRSVIINLIDLIVMFAAISTAARLDAAKVAALTGISAPIRTPLRWAVLLFVPATLVALLAAPIAEGLSPATIWWQGVGFPVIEELVYRGLAVAALVRLSRWPLWMACLWPALFFGLVHLGQGGNPMESAGVFAITGIGGLLFGWLYVRWAYNLWPSIFLHAGLNTLWLVFALGETAVGDWFGNGLRLAVVLAAIALTLKMAPGDR